MARAKHSASFGLAPCQSARRASVALVAVECSGLAVSSEAAPSPCAAHGREPEQSSS